MTAVPDRRLGEVPQAWVTGDSALDTGELESWCRQHLAPYKVPVAFIVVAELPRSEIGKLLRRKLPGASSSKVDLASRPAPDQ
jgi:long-chain acyl-CoA synthetase